MWQSGDAATPRRGRANRGRRPRLQRRQGVAANAVRLFIRGSAPPPAAAQTRSSISCLIVFSWQCLLAPPPTPSAPPTSLLRGEQPQKAQNHKKTVFSHRGTSVAINRGVVIGQSPGSWHFDARLIGGYSKRRKLFLLFWVFMLDCAFVI